MSKAFTRESDESDDEPVFVRPPLPPGTINYITRAGADRLRLRLEELLQRKRAAEPNESGKADQRRLDAAIRNLQSTLESVVIAAAPADPEKAGLGASVTIRHENGEEDVYQIVGVDESDPAEGRISWISPLARVLLSKRAGQKVRFQSPVGVEELTIVKLQYH